MSNGDHPDSSVRKSMEAAEGRVQKGRMDIDAATKLAIAKKETEIRTAIENYKRLGIYEDVGEKFLDTRASDSDTPERLLAQLTFRFDRMHAEETAYAGEMLDTLARETLLALNELKKDLAGAAGDAAQLTMQVEEAYQTFLPEYHFDPSNVSSTLEGIGELLGQRPNIEKLQGFEQENDELLSLIRKPDKADAYALAAGQFRAVTGIHLEQVKPMIAAALQKCADQIKVNPAAARSAFHETYKSALDTFSLVNNVLTNVLFKPGSVSERTERSESLSKSPETGGTFLSEEEMTVVLNLLLYGAKDKGFLAELLDVNTAYEHYTGTQVKDIQDLRLAMTLGAVQGAIDAPLAIIDFGKHMLTHPNRVLHQLVESGKAIFTEAGRRNINAMLNYGWENCSAAEKMFFVSKITNEFVVGSALLGGVLGKIGALAKMSASAAAVGMTETAASFAMILNPVLRNFPRLAQYGAGAIEITANLTTRSETIVAKATHLIHKGAESAEKGIHYAHGAEALEAKTGGAERSALTALSPESPVGRQIEELGIDFDTATAHAEELGISLEQLAQLRKAAQNLKRFSTV